MTSRDLAVAVIFLSHTAVGIFGNFCFLYHNVTSHLRGGRLKSPDLILRHLTFANTLELSSNGVTHTMAALGLKHFLSGFGCKFVFYVHRVATGVFFGTICLLSFLQAITVSPRSSTWVNLKIKAPKYIGLSIYLCWSFHLLVNIVVFIYVSGKWNNTNITKQKELRYCSSAVLDKITTTLFAAF